MGEVNKPVEEQQETSPPKDTTQQYQTIDFNQEEEKEEEHEAIRDENQEETDYQNEYHPMFDYANNPPNEEKDDENDTKSGEMLRNSLTSKTIKDTKAHSTGTSAALSQEELDNLKKTNPTKYLKAIMSANGGSIGKCSSSSSVSGSHPSSD